VAMATDTSGAEDAGFNPAARERVVQGEQQLLSRRLLCSPARRISGMTPANTEDLTLTPPVAQGTDTS
jgi:hypothetical protein